jgi:type IV secretion system protein VirB6
MGLVGLAFIAVNSLTMWVPIRVSEYTKWGVRYIIITAVATSWAQFQPIYDIVTNTPGAVGAELLGATGAPNLNTALDEMITGLFHFSDRAAEESGMFSISLTSVLVWVVGALMACVAIIVTGIGKIGLAMSISLAPIFIPTLMFKATGNLFESWVRFTIGFALIPLVTAGIMGAIVGIGQGMISEADAAAELSDAAGFLIVGAGAIFMMANVPTMVNGLSGTFVATANGINEVRKGGEMAKGTGQRATDAAAPRVAQAASAIGAARNALPGGRVAAALQDAKTTQAAMKEGRAKIGQKNSERGKLTSRAGRREAGQAAMIQMARQNAQGRAMVNADGAGGKDDEAKKKLVQQTVQSASKRKGA